MAKFNIKKRWNNFKISQLREILFVFTVGILFSCQPSSKSGYANLVNPFIGTSSSGHTFPGACIPFGMVQVSPETGLKYAISKI